MINIAGADAQIEVMHWKYSYLFWRPVTAIDPSAVTDDGFGRPAPGYDDGNAPNWRTGGLASTLEHSESSGVPRRARIHHVSSGRSPDGGPGDRYV